MLLLGRNRAINLRSFFKKISKTDKWNLTRSFENRSRKPVKHLLLLDFCIESLDNEYFPAPLCHLHIDSVVLHCQCLIKH